MTEPVRIAVVYDQDFDWAEDLVKYTIRMIANRTDGFHDEIFSDGTAIDWAFRYASCEPNDSPRAYWDLVRDKWNSTSAPPHGLIGARCSSASKELAVLSSVEGVTQVSPASSSGALSDKEQYPYFSRLIGADNAQGQAGALVALLRKFGWNHVGVVITDEQYSRDLANAFQDLWTDGTTDREAGTIAYTYEVSLRNDTVDDGSVTKFLSDARVTDRRINSRGILLVARDKHAASILEAAHASGGSTGFPEETVWIGTDAWVGRVPEQFRTGFDGSAFEPGYTGLTPFQNRLSPEYADFFARVNEMAVAEKGVPLFAPGEVLDYSAATLVDSIVALTKALSALDPQDRNDGLKVTEMLRSQNFTGVSGRVAFTPEGDLLDPSYNILNTVRDPATGAVRWNAVGTVSSSTADHHWITNFNNLTCFDAQCQLTSPPDDTYYVFPLPIWVVVVLPVVAVVFSLLLVRYCRSSYRIRAYTAMISTATDELNRLIQDRFQSPAHWEEGRDGPVEVDPTEDEYWNVLGQLQESMPDAHISHLWRIQNHSLWAYYSSHKDRWTLMGTAHNEIQVWHGTSNVDPDVIYNDPQDGFIMQLAKYGFWGRGLYFALRSAYSHCYAYKPYGDHWQATYGDRPKGVVADREMFLVKLLVGTEIDMPRDANLIIPPHIQGNSGPRHNTVTGIADDGTKVYVLYENGRAYPEYLVRYYRGSRDDCRTPFETQAEAKRALKRDAVMPVVTAKETMSDCSSGAGGTPTDVETWSVHSVCWEYEDNHGWNRYSDAHQAILEAAHRRGDCKVWLQANQWNYEVDLEAGIQTNLSHADHTQRRVQRLINA